MNHPRVPETDSIQELANFWETHDLTDFEDELREVRERVFDKDTEITVHLERDDAQAVREMARLRGLRAWELIRDWVRERIHST
jgi:predicted DNA binding CopG/RHH family protein